MALQGAMGAGSYTTIASVDYRKQDKEVFLEVNTYQNSDKRMLLSNMRIYVNDRQGKLEVLETVNSVATPANPDHTLIYHVGDNPTGDWDTLGFANKIVSYDDMQDTWVDMGSIDQNFWCAADELTYALTDSGLHRSNTTDERAFDKFFSITAMSLAGNDILSASYGFLKTLPVYENATDV